jgi:hypothetical protein
LKNAVAQSHSKLLKVAQSCVKKQQSCKIAPGGNGGNDNTRKRNPWSNFEQLRFLWKFEQLRFLCKFEQLRFISNFDQFRVTWSNFNF